MLIIAIFCYSNLEFSTPVIYPVSEVLNDHVEKIVCNVSSLKVRGSIPSHSNISLSRDGNMLNNSHGKPSVEYNFVPNLEQDDGAEILCEANLLLGAQVLRKNANQTLKVVGKLHLLHSRLTFFLSSFRLGMLICY